MHYDPYAGFHCETLPNGLSVFTKEVDAPWIYVGFVVHVGAREDPAGCDGMIHLVEHLVSENVEDWTFIDLQKRLKELGGYGDFGEVDYRSTSYSFFVPDDQAILDEALSLFGAMLITAKLQRNIEQEKAIITHEYREEYPYEQLRTWTLIGKEALFREHPRLSHYDTALGSLSEIARCTPEELQALYDRFYVPANISVVSVGHISKQALEEALQRSPFGTAKKGQRNGLPSPFALTLPREHELVISLRDWSHLSFSQTRCSFEWALPTVFGTYPVWIVRALLQKRLFRILRHERALIYDVNVRSTSYQDCRLLGIDLEVSPNAVQEIRETIWSILQSLQTAEADFGETKREILTALQRPDFSGSDLLRSAMGDLEGYHRLLPFIEEIQQLERVTFEEMVQLSIYLTPERHFQRIIQP